MGPREPLTTARADARGGGLGRRAETPPSSEHGLSALTYWTEPAGDYLGMMQVNGDKAFAAGFEMRPLEQTTSGPIDASSGPD